MPKKYFYQNVNFSSHVLRNIKVVPQSVNVKMILRSKVISTRSSQVYDPKTMTSSMITCRGNITRLWNCIIVNSSILNEQGWEYRGSKQNSNTVICTFSLVQNYTNRHVTSNLFSGRLLHRLHFIEELTNLYIMNATNIYLLQSYQVGLLVQESLVALVVPEHLFLEAQEVPLAQVVHLAQHHL